MNGSLCSPFFKLFAMSPCRPFSGLFWHDVEMGDMKNRDQRGIYTALVRKRIQFRGSCFEENSSGLLHPPRVPVSFGRYGNHKAELKQGRAKNGSWKAGFWFAILWSTKGVHLKVGSSSWGIPTSASSQPR